MQVTAQQNAAAAQGAGGVEAGLVGHAHVLAQHLDAAALAVAGAGRDLGIAVHRGVAAGLQHDAPALHAHLRGLHLAAQVQRAGKQPDGVALQSAQAEGLVAGGLYLQGDALQAAPGDVDALAGGQDDGAVGRLQQRALRRLDARGDEHQIAAAGHDVALHDDAAHRRGRAAAAEVQASGAGIGVAHADGGGGEGGGIDHGPGTDGDAALVHQHHLAVARKRAKDQRRRVRHHAVDGQAAGAGLQDLRAAAGRDGEALPVDGGVVAAGGVLCRH